VRKSFVLEQYQHLLLCASVGVLLSIGLLARVVRPDALIARPKDGDAIFWQTSKATPCIGDCEAQEGLEYQSRYLGWYNDKPKVRLMSPTCCQQSKDCLHNIVPDTPSSSAEDTSLAYASRDSDRHFEALSKSKTAHRQGAELYTKPCYVHPVLCTLYLTLL
jgi:hypothetical protein